MKSTATPLWIIVILLLFSITYYLVSHRQRTLSKTDYAYVKSMYEMSVESARLDRELGNTPNQATLDNIQHYGEMLKTYKSE